MQGGRVLVHRGCGLCAAISIQAAVIGGVNAVLAKNALERSGTVVGFGCVISHVFSLVPFCINLREHWMRDFRVEILD
jgi:hypothetical protein